jgi:hypothetical protein
VGVASEQLALLGAWLKRHGQHVRRLSLDTGLREGEDWPDAATEQLSHCASEVPQLQQFLLMIWYDAKDDVEADWVRQLPASLRELGVCIPLASWSPAIRLTASLTGLTQLTKLMLSAPDIKMNQNVGLPPSIRTLALKPRSDCGLPRQASAVHSVRRAARSGLPDVLLACRRSPPRPSSQHSVSLSSLILRSCPP